MCCRVRKAICVVSVPLFDTGSGALAEWLFDGANEGISDADLVAWVDQVGLPLLMQQLPQNLVPCWGNLADDKLSCPECGNAAECVAYSPLR